MFKKIYKTLGRFFDPYKQSIFFFDFRFMHGAFIFFASAAAFLMRAKQPVESLFSNPLVFLPNYLIHESAHNLSWKFVWWMQYPIGHCPGKVPFCIDLGEWLSIVAGSGTEVMVPAMLLLLALQLRGGRMLKPLLFYWLSTTLYNTAVYVSDARASKLFLTSSDMMTNYKPGEVKGDWYNILVPINMLKWDTAIGIVLYILAALSLTLAFYTLWYIITKSEKHIQADRHTDPWETAEIENKKTNNTLEIINPKTLKDPFKDEHGNFLN